MVMMIAFIIIIKQLRLTVREGICVGQRPGLYFEGNLEGSERSVEERRGLG